MRKAAYFLIIWFILSSGISPLAAGMSKEGWSLKWEDGHSIYFVRNGDKNEFRIVCGDETVGAELQFLVNGKKPQANSLVTIILDKTNIIMKADGGGIVNTNCSECADNFARVLQGVKYSKKTAVWLSDGSQAEFDTLGARELLKGTICVTGFYH